MRILLDESVPRPLARRLSGHHVSTVPREGWAGLKNGELLRHVEGAFDVFITGDRGLQHQQNFGSISFGIVVISALDNRVETILAMAEAILSAAKSVRPGTVVTVAA